MRHASRPAIPPQPQPYRTQACEHLGLVAGLCAELGLPAVIDRATKQDPARRRVTAGQAVKAMGLHGLGFLHPQRDLVPPCFPPTPLARRMAPGMQARHLKDAPLGRALETRSDFGVPALDGLMAATAAARLGLTRTCSQRDTTRWHGDGR